MELFLDTYTWIIFSFAVFLFAAFKFARPVILGMLDAKISVIKNEIQRAETLHAEATALLLEFEDRRRDREARLARGHRRDPLAAADRCGQLDVVIRRHLGFVVEHVELRRTVRHEQPNDPLGGRRPMKDFQRSE